LRQRYQLVVDGDFSGESEFNTTKKFLEKKVQKLKLLARPRRRPLLCDFHSSIIKRPHKNWPSAVNRTSIDCLLKSRLFYFHRARYYYITHPGKHRSSHSNNSVTFTLLRPRASFHQQWHLNRSMLQRMLNQYTSTMAEIVRTRCHHPTLTSLDHGSTSAASTGASPTENWQTASFSPLSQ
jgi:hypothetical protein